MIKHIILWMFFCSAAFAQVPQITLQIQDDQGNPTGDTVTIDVVVAARRGGGDALPSPDFTVPILNAQSEDTGDVLSVDAQVTVTHN